MRRTQTLFASRSAGAVALVGSVFLICDCSSSTQQLGFVEDPGPPPALTTPDAAASVAEAGLTSYCPSSKCPAGWTTCPTSRFPCDVNLLTDINNCGGCGVVCPPSGGAEAFSCATGACVLQCTELGLDCDGLLDNGCEVREPNNEHCGACGKKCTDPAKTCAYQGESQSDPIDCGCPAGKVLCNGRFCYDVESNDKHCGGCGDSCDPTGGGAPVYANAYYGCLKRQCGAFKCKSQYADCNGERSDGCETSLVSDEHCGGCGLACPAGQSCRIDLRNSRPTCMCPPDKTYCNGACADLTTDTNHCGGCGNRCTTALPGATATCRYAMCSMACDAGRADCNNSEADGCEVNIYSDPRNCGGCGHVCDLLAGQACVAGQCVVEPCATDAGVVAR